MEQRRQRGLTLIGALVALLIMSIGMTALFRLYNDTRLNNHAVTVTAMALGLARDKLEQLRFDPGAAANGVDNHTINAMAFERHWQCTDNPALNTRQIDVTLQWSDVSGDHALSLTTTVDRQALLFWPPGDP